MVYFFQGLPERISLKIFQDLKLDIDDPHSFTAAGGITARVRQALTLNKMEASVNRLLGAGILTADPRRDQRQKANTQTDNIGGPTAGNQGKLPTAAFHPTIPQPPRHPAADASRNRGEGEQVARENEKVKQWATRIEDLEKEMEMEMEKERLFQQSAMVPNNVRAYGGQQYCFKQARPNYRQQGASNMNAATESIPVNPRGCRWCGLNDRRKFQCLEYQNALKEGVIHYLDSADSKAYFGPQGSGGPADTHPEFSGVCQKVWVSDMRRKGESEGGELATNVRGAVRNLMLQEAPRIEEVVDEPLAGVVRRGGPQIKVGEARAYPAIQNGGGDITGWVETERGVE